MIKPKGKPIRIMCQTDGAEGADMGYATFVVELSFIKWVREVMAEVAAKKAGGGMIYCFEYWCYAATYGNDVQLIPTADKRTNDDWHTNKGWHVVHDAAHFRNNQSAEAPVIRITDNGCVFKAYPENGYPDAVVTPTITKENLDVWELLCLGGGLIPKEA